jgi:hypothetical protein
MLKKQRLQRLGGCSSLCEAGTTSCGSSQLLRCFWKMEGDMKREETIDNMTDDEMDKIFGSAVVVKNASRRR